MGHTEDYVTLEPRQWMIFLCTYIGLLMLAAWWVWPRQAAKEAVQQGASKEREVSKGIASLPPETLTQLVAQLVEAQPHLRPLVDAAVTANLTLRAVPLPHMEITLSEVGGLATFPTPGKPLLCLAQADGDRDVIHFLDAKMRLCGTLEPTFLWSSVGDVPLAAGEHGLYVASGDEDQPGIYRIGVRASVHGLTTTQLAVHPGQKSPVALSMCLCSSNSTLYVMRHTEIVALDAISLKPRLHLGRGILQQARSLAVLENRLYVCDTSKPGVLKVFTLDGTPLEDVSGPWAGPWAVCASEERLFLVEDAYSAVPTPSSPPNPPNPPAPPGKVGSRIFVLNAGGEVLQVYVPPPSVELTVHMCIMSGAHGGGRLVCVNNDAPADSRQEDHPCHSLALLAGAE
jgi:hypothetical protein